MDTETAAAVEADQSELDAFKAKLYEAAQEAKRAHGWCGEIDEILNRLGVQAPKTAIGEGPTEDGLYTVNGCTYFIIRYQGEWMHTALRDSQSHTSHQPGSWADMVNFVTSRLLGIAPERVGESLVKVG